MAKSGTLRVRILGDTGPLEKSLKGAKGKIGKFAGMAAKAGAAAAAGFGVLAVKSFADFDEQMNKSLAIMGDVSDGMRKDMSDAARTVGKTTKFSAAEAAESYFFLASAGLDAEQQIAALPQVAAFAQAGMFDMATATDLATDAQSALGLASDDAEENLKNLTRVTDVFVKANTLANTSVEQISEAMTNKAGAAMRSVGMDIEEGSAVLAAFADQGVKGAEAGTQFAIVLRDLQTKALDNKDAFEEAGVAVFDADGEMRNMADIVGDLEGHMDGMSDAQKKAALSTMGFSDKSIASLQALMGTSDAIREYEGELRKAGGTVKDVADKQMETFNAKLGLLKDRFMDFAIGAGSVIVPMILDAFDAISGWWESNGPAIMAHVKTIRDGLVKFADQARPVIERVVGFLRDNAKPVFAAIAAVVGGAVVGAVWSLVAAIGALMSPVVLVVGAIAALAAGAVYAYENFETFREVVDTVWQAVQGIFHSAVEAITAIVSTGVSIITEFWDRFGTHIIQFAQETWNNIVNLIGGVLDVIKGIFDTFAGLFTGDWSRMWEGIKGIFGGVWDAIKAILGQAFDTIKTILGGAVAAISQMWSELWERVKGVVTGAFDFIKNLFLNFTGPGLLLQHWDKIREGISDVTGFFREKWDAVLTFFRGIPGKIGSAASGMWDGIKNAFRSAINFIIGAWNRLEFRIPGFDPPGPGPKFDGFTLGVPDIPMLEKGGEVAKTGLAVVHKGERFSGTNNEFPIGGGKVENHFHFPNYVGSKTELMQVVKAELAKDARRGGTLIANVAAQ